MRDYEVAIPSDCIISNTAKENTEALQLMKRYLKADTRRSQCVTLGNESGSDNFSCIRFILAAGNAPRPSQVVAGENVVICCAIIPAITPNQRRK
jgi:hypothetical protein